MTVNKVNKETNEVLESYQNVIAYTEFVIRVQAGRGVATLFASDDEKFVKDGENDWED